MLGRFIKTYLAQVGRPDMLIAVALLGLADVALHLVAQRLATGQEHGHARG